MSSQQMFLFQRQIFHWLHLHNAFLPVLTAFPIPARDSGSKAVQYSFLGITTCYKARTEGSVQMEMEIPTFTADLVTDGTAPSIKVLLLMEKKL